MSETEGRLPWREVIRVYLRPRVVAMAFLGFSAGLPFLLVFSTLSAWLRDEDLSRSAIGFFAWIGMTYSIKFAWAPVVDRLVLPGVTTTLGRRRGWMLLGQTGIAAGLILMAMIGPGASLVPFALAALLVAFSSATQDIAIDAWRIEAEVEDVQGAMSATYILGYRIALLAAGAGALFLAEAWNWTLAYLAMASLMAVGMFTVLVVGEPEHQPQATPAGGGAASRLSAWFVQAVVNPFVDFFIRNGRFAVVVLIFVACYRLSDIAMGIMANPFYLDMGYTKGEIAAVAKFFGFFMAIAGSACGGLAVLRYGVLPVLMAGAIAVATTNLLFAALANLEPTTAGLALVISADTLSGGFASAAFIAYLSSLTNRVYTATQYALFSSLMTLPGKFMSGFSGVVVDNAGYTAFFVVAALLGLPAIYLVTLLIRRRAQGSQA